MIRLSFAAMLTLAACGGETPAPPPEPTPEPAPAPEPTPEPTPAPATATPAPDLAAMSEADRLAWLMTEGEKVYTTGGSGGVACVTCHQANGEGLPGAFPPLKGSGDFMGDCAKHAGIVINGLQGEIVVQGATYNGVMPPQGNLQDSEIAAVVTYERQSWGNTFGPCLPADVAAARAAGAAH
jgi:mono/diheme cytochrome c family protein